MARFGFVLHDDLRVKAQAYLASVSQHAGRPVTFGELLRYSLQHVIDTLPAEIVAAGVGPRRSYRSRKRKQETQETQE